uniref:BTB domain-containing protein n=1 Tax=Macrostomum lignano TaxID=282301 RepID=A0A1I8FZZ0_9PLAT
MANNHRPGFGFQPNSQTANGASGTKPEDQPFQSIEAWETGQTRESALLSARVDPAERDQETAEWRQITLVVDGKELYANSAHLASVSPVFRRMIADLNQPVKKGKGGKGDAAGNRGSNPKAGGRGRSASLAGKKQQQQPEDRLEIEDASYEDMYEFLLALQPQGLLQEEKTINTNNVVSLLSLSRRFHVSFLWDRCLIALREDVRPSNVLRHYACLRLKGVPELEEIFFTLCLELLRETNPQLLEQDPWYQRLNRDAQIHLRVALVSCPKCRDVKTLQHKMCDTQSKEFVRLNQCRKCKVKMLDVQWVWGQES